MTQFSAAISANAPHVGTRRSLSIATWLLIFAAVTGCTSWVARPGGMTPPPAPDDRVRICANGTCREYHAVRTFGDSVSATPYFKSTRCDSCAVHFPAAAIQSVQERRFDVNKNIVLMIVTVPIAAYLYGMSKIAD